MRRFPGVLLEVRAARAAGIPHSTVRFGKSPRKWRPKDRLLLLALTMFEDGLCPHCGQPRDRAWNDDMDGYYEVHEATCVACQAKERAQDGKKPSGSRVAYVTDAAPAGYSPDLRMVTDRKV